jgi:hypothetical protein
MILGAVSSSQQHGEELFSAKVKAGTRTYFIDVPRAANGAGTAMPQDGVNSAPHARREAA